jgi:hypothetical protein
MESGKGDLISRNPVPYDANKVLTDVCEGANCSVRRCGFGSGLGSLFPLIASGIFMLGVRFQPQPDIRYV